MPKDVVMKRVGYGEVDREGRPEIVYLPEEPKYEPLWWLLARGAFIFLFGGFFPGVAIISLIQRWG